MTMKYREYFTQIQALDGFDDVERKNLPMFVFDAEKDDNNIKSINYNYYVSPLNKDLYYIKII